MSEIDKRVIILIAVFPYLYKKAPRNGGALYRVREELSIYFSFSGKSLSRQD